MGLLESNNSKGSFLFTPFLNWYAPYFNAYSFPLARANEYEADATSARLTSPRTAAEALTNVDVVGSYIGERYWPQIYQQADDLPQPSVGPFAIMGERFARELDAASSQNWLDRALANQTTSGDTHPALSDRLRAIGESPQLNPPKPGQAADQLLGAALPAITDSFDLRWQEQVQLAWQERYQQVQTERRQLAELDEKHAEGQELSLQESYDRAKLTESAGHDADAALDQFRALLESHPDNALLSYTLGVRLLARTDDAGMELIQKAMQLDEEAAVSACEVLRDYCWQQGRKEEAQSWQLRMIECSKLQQMVDHEKKNLFIQDHFDPHGLDEDKLAQLQAELKSIPGLCKAYLVKKRIPSRPGLLFYVLGYTATEKYRFYNKRRAIQVLDQIQQTVTFSGETSIINVEKSNAKFEKIFLKVNDSRIL